MAIWAPGQTHMKGVIFPKRVENFYSKSEEDRDDLYWILTALCSLFPLNHTTA